MRRKPMRTINARIEEEKFGELNAVLRDGENISDLVRDGIDLVLRARKHKQANLAPKNKPIETRSPRSASETKEKDEGRKQCDGKYMVGETEHQCKMSDGGYCIREKIPLNCPKLTKEELEELRGKKKGGE